MRSQEKTNGRGHRIQGEFLPGRQIRGVHSERRQKRREPITVHARFPKDIQSPDRNHEKGDPGAGHLGGEIFKQRGGFFAVHIPYAGGAPSQLALISGQVDYTLDNLATAAANIQAPPPAASGVAWPGGAASSTRPAASASVSTQAVARSLTARGNDAPLTARSGSPRAGMAVSSPDAGPVGSVQAISAARSRPVRPA